MNGITEKKLFSIKDVIYIISFASTVLGVGYKLDSKIEDVKAIVTESKAYAEGEKNLIKLEISNLKSDNEQNKAEIYKLRELFATLPERPEFKRR